MLAKTQRFVFRIFHHVVVEVIPGFFVKKGNGLEAMYLQYISSFEFVRKQNRTVKTNP
jgi:hypothetical protein